MVDGEKKLIQRIIRRGVVRYEGTDYWTKTLACHMKCYFVFDPTQDTSDGVLRGLVGDDKIELTAVQNGNNVSAFPVRVIEEARQRHQKKRQSLLSHLIHQSRQ